jgi:uncharacterized protein YbaP (TraB family)
MQVFRSWSISIALAAMFATMLVATATAAPLWEIEGTANRIHLLGSVHFLRAADGPLPDSVMDLYANADVIVFEIDLSQLTPADIAATMQRTAIDPRGRSLEDILGERTYRDAVVLATDIGIDMAVLRPYEPWFAALQVTQIRLGQLGYDGTHGVESQLAQLTARDGKSTSGLETLQEQFDALDSLPADVQREFLLQTIEDAAEIDADLDQIVAAWKAGDTRTLEDELLAELEEYPALYENILVRRNRNWTRQIIEFTRSSKDYLIVVGALHLVGDDSVIRMLEDAGFQTRQLRSSPR